MQGFRVALEASRTEETGPACGAGLTRTPARQILGAVAGGAGKALHFLVHLSAEEASLNSQRAVETTSAGCGTGKAAGGWGGRRPNRCCAGVAEKVGPVRTDLALQIQHVDFVRAVAVPVRSTAIESAEATGVANAEGLVGCVVGLAAAVPSQAFVDKRACLNFNQSLAGGGSAEVSREKDSEVAVVNRKLALPAKKEKRLVPRRQLRVQESQRGCALRGQSGARRASVVGQGAASQLKQAVLEVNSPASHRPAVVHKVSAAQQERALGFPLLERVVVAWVQQVRGVEAGKQTPTHVSRAGVKQA